MTSIAAEAARTAGGVLGLTFIARGAIDGVALPPLTRAGRADELWRHTCFEAFVRAAGSDAYFEFNFSPSTEWAAYAFNGYRNGMQNVPDIAPPEISIRATHTVFELRTQLALSGLAHLPPAATWQLGLSAIVEERNGAKSYWAVAHPPGKPDFHHADCFALELPPASGA